MALTRPTFTSITTSVVSLSDPLTVLHGGATSANVDVGFLINRANGLVSNVALYWSESGQSFVTAFTSNTGVTDSNVTVTSYANLTVGTLYGSVNATGNIVAGSGTTSTSTTTGALQVVGGVGITGNISGNVAYGSQLTLAGNVNTALTITSLDTIAAWKPVKTLNIAAIDGTSAGIYVKSDGTKAYVLGQSNDRVSELTLSTPYDITTGSNVGIVSVVSQDGTARGVRFKPDGTKMYITGGTNTRVYEYTLSTPWQANTAANVGTFLLTPTVVSAYGIEFNTDGSKMYVGQNAGNIAAFALATPWSVNSASYSAGLTVTSVETSLTAFSFNSTGTQLMLYGSNGKAFVVYTLGTAYDITTAVYTGQLRNDRYNQLNQTTIPGLHWLNTQNYFYVTDYQADEIVQYQTNIGGVSLSSASSTRFANTVIMDGSLLAGNIYTTGNIVTSGVNTYLYFNGITSISSLTATGTVTFNNTGSTISIGTSQTTGNTAIGGTSQTGNLNIGPSTANVTYWNWYGATAANNTKNIIIGTGGLAGSFSNIQIGPLTGTGNVYFQAATQVNISNTQTSTSTTTGALVVAGGVGIAGNVNIGANLYVNTITTTAGSNGNLTIDPDGAGDLIISPATEMFVQSTLASTNTGSGALVVAGGVGIAGNIIAGGYAQLGGASVTDLAGGTYGAAIVIPGNNWGIYSNISTQGTVYLRQVIGKDSGNNIVIGHGGTALNANVNIISGAGASNSFNVLQTNTLTPLLTVNSLGNTVVIANAQASTSNVTGALQVAGGVGVAGNINASGNIYAVGTNSRHGFTWANSVSSAYTVFNSATNSIDTVFG